MCREIKKKTLLSVDTKRKSTVKTVLFLFGAGVEKPRLTLMLFRCYAPYGIKKVSHNSVVLFLLADSPS